jgi:glycosyltransferase involved in cell wall biosynthesis
MRVVFACLYRGAARPDLTEHLEAYPLHRELPRAVAAHGYEVSVVHHHPVNARLELGGVTHHALAPSPLVRLAARLAGPRVAFHEPAFGAIRRVVDLEADVVHCHGITLAVNLALLRRRLSGTPLVIHSHGVHVPRSGLARRLQRANLARADRLLFTSAELARPLVEGGVLDGLGRVEEVVETSTSFTRMAREEARQRTGLHGDPVVLWVGRLHPIKDPLTVLEAVDRMRRHGSGLRLYMFYRTAELEPEVRAVLAERPGLAECVELRGAVPHANMEAVMSSADLLVQASRREFSGYAVLEAMACGVVPVLSDIPAHRAMTAGGAQGVLFAAGDAGALATAVASIAAAELPARSRAVRAHFEAELSFPAMAGKLDRLYRRLVA